MLLTDKWQGNYDGIYGCNDNNELTDGRNGRHDFPELELVQDGCLSGGVKTNWKAKAQVKFLGTVAKGDIGKLAYVNNDSNKTSLL